jgi:ankyrin repeat protein
MITRTTITIEPFISFLLTSRMNLYVESLDLSYAVVTSRETGDLLEVLFTRFPKLRKLSLFDVKGSVKQAPEFNSHSKLVPLEVLNIKYCTILSRATATVILKLLPSLKVLVSDLLFANFPALPNLHTLDMFPHSVNMKDLKQKLPLLQTLFAYNATNPVEGVLLVDNAMSKNILNLPLPTLRTLKPFISHGELYSLHLTLLQAAVIHGDAQLIRFLQRECGLNPNTRQGALDEGIHPFLPTFPFLASGGKVNYLGNNALHIAVEKDYLAIAQELIDLGADPNIANKDGHTPLYYAQSDAMVQLLAAAKASFTVVDSKGWIPLAYFVMRSSYIHGYAGNEIVKRVIALHVENGADLNILDNQNRSLLSLAIASARLTIIEELLEYEEVQVQHDLDHINQPLHYLIVKKGPSQLIKRFLERGADPCKVTENDATALLLATKYDHFGATFTIISHCLSLEDNDDCLNVLCNRPDKYGWTPLHYAVLGKKDVPQKAAKKRTFSNREDEEFTLFDPEPVSTNTFTSLMQCSELDINSQNLFGETPLMLLCRSNHMSNLSRIQQLVEKGANVDLKDINGQTPLIAACMKGNKNIAKILLCAGADPNAKDEQNLSPLLAAVQDFVVDQYESRELNSKLIELLLEYNVDTNHQDNILGYGALHHLAKFSPVSTTLLGLINSMVHHKADINQKNSLGQTPLILAVFYNLKTTAETFLALGADPGNCILYALMQKQTYTVDKSYEKMIPIEMTVNDIRLRYPWWSLYSLQSTYSSKYAISPAFADEVFYGILHRKTAQDIDDILTMLVQHSQSIVNFQDAQNRNILHFMALLPHTGSRTALHNKIQTLVDKTLVNDEDIYGNTPLHAVAMNSDSQAAQTYMFSYLSLGADINIKNNRGETPVMMFIAQQMPYDNLRILFTHKGFDANIKNDHGDTYLHLLARDPYYKAKSFIQFALSNKRLLENINRDGETPLMLLFTSKRSTDALIEFFEAIDTLYRGDIDYNVRNDRSGQTLLHYVSLFYLSNDEDQKGQIIKLARLLLKHGGNIEAKDKKNFTARDLAPLIWNAVDESDLDKRVHQSLQIYNQVDVVDDEISRVTKDIKSAMNDIIVPGDA